MVHRGVPTGSRHSPQGLAQNIAPLLIMPEPSAATIAAQLNPQHLYLVPSTPFPWMTALKSGNWVEPSLEHKALQGSVHPEAMCLFRPALEVTRYPAQVNGKKRSLTADEYAATFPGHRLPYTKEAKQCKSLKNQIKRKISPRFRHLEDIKKSRALIKA